MKKQKAIESVWLAKTLSVVLAVLIVVAMYMLPASAAELTADGSGASTVAHTVSTEFTAGIPAYVMPDEIGEKTAKYTVTLESAVIPDSHELTAKVEYSGSMAEQNGVELPYELFDETGNAIVSGAKVLSKAAGTPDDSVSVSFGAALTAKARYAGVYTDTATFTFDVAEKVYTLDEIKADEHLYAIGLTKPEYVVAQFNEDFSAVTIFKNGENSDGLMKHWSLSDKSPLSTQTELKYVTVKYGVKSIGSEAFNGFNGCKFIESVTLPEGLQRLGSEAFCGCTSLADIDIPDSVTDLGAYCFDRCTALKSIKLPASISKIADNLLDQCSALETVRIPTNVTQIGGHAFFGCKTLTEITLPNAVEVIGDYAFSGCSKLVNIAVSDKVHEIGTDAFSGTGIESFAIPNSVTELGSGIFNGCRNLKTVVWGREITTIPNSTFLGCSALVFDIPAWVTNIGTEAFSGCSSLTEAVIPEGVTSIGARAFYTCKNLKQITIPASVSSIENTAFEASQNIYIPKDRVFYITTGSYAETFLSEKGYTFIAQ